MSKGSKEIRNNRKAEKDKAHDKSHDKNAEIRDKHYLFSMSNAPAVDESTHWFQMLPAAFFTAVVIIITRMAVYERPMQQFFWSGGKNDLTDFFSYYKMTAILICTIAVLVLLLYRVFIQSLYIKRSFAYIPMVLYAIFVLLSYAFSDYKEFALWGWNDRFEGTLVLLGYMVMLFFIINSVNTERNVKWIVYPLAASSALLGLLGLTQALDHDFFQAAIGKKLITPSWFWDQIDNLSFTFQNKEIYQTVYNINYVSFYLTLLIPLFGLLFVRSLILGKGEPLFKKLLWGALFALLVFNLIGSASSGGLMGMAVVVLMAIIVLNKKIIQWWKPIAMLLALTIIVAGASYGRWLPELSTAIDSVTGKSAQRIEENRVRHKIDYMETTGDSIVLGYEGDHVTFKTYSDDPASISITESDGSALTLSPTSEDPSVFQFVDERYSWITVRPAQDDQKNHYILLSTDGHDWPFQLTEDGPKYYTGTKYPVDLRRIPAIGWEDNQSFGSGRGYIWSRTLPMMKDTLVLGHGADTYCIYFPQGDYVGKYNSDSFTNNINIIVDKPHNMYMGSIIGTGAISMITLLILWFSYIVESFVLYRKNRSDNFLSYTGLGIFLGICGFLAAGLVNDSSVSTMPMFYGLLGTGIAINMMLKKFKVTEN